LRLGGCKDGGVLNSYQVSRKQKAQRRIVMADFEFHDTELPGLVRIQPRYFVDERGYYLKSFEKSVFLDHGLPVTFVEINETLSRKGVLRGIHFQMEYPQGKLAHVSHGGGYEVAVDLRPESPTFGKWQGFEMSAANKLMLYLPEGFGTAFLATEDDTIFAYQCTGPYMPEYDAGVMWNDPDIGIGWPLERVGELIISEKDKNQPSFRAYCARVGK
jgi:dTDP-4-dehydrorhamnose 3,5-epimerase